jgi:hypothetical protein
MRCSASDCTGSRSHAPAERAHGALSEMWTCARRTDTPAPRDELWCSCLEQTGAQVG